MPTGAAAPSPAAQRPAASRSRRRRPSRRATGTGPADAGATRRRDAIDPRQGPTPATAETAAAAPAPTPTRHSRRSRHVAPRRRAERPPHRRPRPSRRARHRRRDPDAGRRAARPQPLRRRPPTRRQTPAAADPELEQLLAAWPAIVAQLSAHPPTKPLIVACRPVAVDGAIVTLGFPEEQAFLKDAAERRRPAIEAGISAVLGHPVAVRCVVANVELPPVAPSCGRLVVLAEARRIFADDLADVGEIS